VLSVAVKAMEYRRMKEQLEYYSGQFCEMKATLHALDRAECEFRKLFSLGTKEQVLENVQFSNTGSIDIGKLQGQIKDPIGKVKEIREYLAHQKDICNATPGGWPGNGRITSPYGNRENPVRGGGEISIRE